MTTEDIWSLAKPFYQYLIPILIIAGIIAGIMGLIILINKRG